MNKRGAIQRWLLALLVSGPGMAYGFTGSDAEAPQHEEAVAFLAAAGYPAAAYTLLYSWNQALDGDEPGFVRGYCLATAGDGAPFTVYSRNGRVLSEEACEALGLGQKDWEPGAVTQPAVRIPGARKAASPLPVGVQYGVLPMDTVVLPKLDHAKLRAEEKRGLAGPEKGMFRLGVFQALPERLDLAGGTVSHGEWSVLADASFLWSLLMWAPGAVGQRIEFEALSLPAGAQVTIYNAETPNEAYGPFTGLGPDGDTLWTPTCFGEVVAIECHVPADAERAEVRLAIGRIAHVYKTMPELLSAAGACNLDVTCYSEWADAALGVGGMGLVGQSGTLFCTCALIADLDDCTDIPYVLTANHCVGCQSGCTRGSNAVEFYWFYQTASCNGSAPSAASVPRTYGGADYLAGMDGSGTAGLGNDFTFLRLRTAPPAETTMLGWSTAAPPLGTEVTCVHHPRGDFKRISFGNLTNVDNPHSAYFHEVTWHDGTTEPGSSGSPLMLTATQQIIGQLWGGFASCAFPLEPDYYGRFNITYSVVASYMNPAPIAVGFSTASFSASEGSGSATITLSLNKPSPNSGFKVDYAVLEGTATKDDDFTETTGTVTFYTGQSNRTFPVPIIDDYHTEADETVLLTLTGSQCLAINPEADSATLTLVDDDLDTDGEGISDYDEEHGTYGAITDPDKADTDGDGLSDYEEVMGTYGWITNPNVQDTDGDGIRDGMEIFFGLDPTEPGDGSAVPSLSIPLFR